MGSGLTPLQIGHFRLTEALESFERLVCRGASPDPIGSRNHARIH